MAASELVQITSRSLNKVLAGERVETDPDIVSQCGTIAVSYIVNLLLILIFIAVIFALAGYYNPLGAPFATPVLRMMLAISNLITFALTYVASLTWKMHDSAIETQLAANRARGAFIVFAALFSIASLFFLAVPFLFLHVGVLLASAVVNSALLQLLMSRRIFKSKYQGVKT
jgi:hypothetical protein